MHWWKTPRGKHHQGNKKMAAIHADSSNQIAALKELYKDDKEYMKDLV